MVPLAGGKLKPAGSAGRFAASEPDFPSSQSCGSGCLRRIDPLELRLLQIEGGHLVTALVQFVHNPALQEVLFLRNASHPTMPA